MHGRCFAIVLGVCVLASGYLHTFGCLGTPIGHLETLEIHVTVTVNNFNAIPDEPMCMVTVSDRTEHPRTKSVAGPF